MKQGQTNLNCNTFGSEMTHGQPTPNPALSRLQTQEGTTGIRVKRLLGQVLQGTYQSQWGDQSTVKQQ